MIKEDLVFTTEENYTAIVKFIRNSHYCGYVGVPKEHKDYGKDYDDIDGIVIFA